MPSKVPVKEIVLGVSLVALHVLVFWLWQRAMPLIVGHAHDQYTPFILAFCGLILAAVVFSLAVLLIKKKEVVYTVVAAALIAPFMYVPASLSALALLAVCVLLGLFAARRMHTEFAFSVGFSVSRIFRAGLPYYFTALALILSLYYFIELGHVQSVSDVLPESAFRITFQVLGGPLKAVTGLNLRTNATVDDFLEDIIKDQIKKQGLPLSEVPPSELKRLIAMQRDELAARYHAKLTGKENLSDAFRTTIAERIGDILGPYQAYLPYASTIAFFLGVKTLTLPLYFITLGLTFLLIKLLIWGKIIALKKIEIEIERPEFTQP